MTDQGMEEQDLTKLEEQANRGKEMPNKDPASKKQRRKRITQLESRRKHSVARK